MSSTNRASETVLAILAVLAIGASLAIIIGAWFADMTIADFLFV